MIGPQVQNRPDTLTFPPRMVPQIVESRQPTHVLSYMNGGRDVLASRIPLPSLLAILRACPYDQDVCRALDSIAPPSRCSRLPETALS